MSVVGYFSAVKTRRVENAWLQPTRPETRWSAALRLLLLVVVMAGVEKGWGQENNQRIDPCKMPNIQLLQQMKFYLNEKSFRELELEKPMGVLPLSYWDIGSGGSVFATWSPQLDSVIEAQPNCATGRVLRLIKITAELVTLYEQQTTATESAQPRSGPSARLAEADCRPHRASSLAQPGAHVTAELDADCSEQAHFRSPVAGPKLRQAGCPY